MFFSVPPDAYGGARRRSTVNGAAGGPQPPADGLTALATTSSAAAPLGYPATHEGSVPASLPALVYGPEGHVPPPSVLCDTTTDVVASVSADSHANEHERRVHTSFDLPPSLITCLVRHTDGQHQPLATPAIVERCMRDLQRQLMPWVPVERLFGSTIQATVPINAKGDALPVATSSAAPPPTSTPRAGSYLAGTRVRLQLAKTTDVAAVSGGTSSVLHLLLYAVDEPTSRPSVLAQIAQEWRAVLARTGEAEECLVLLVHGDLIAAAEAASRLAEEAQRQGTPGPAAPRAATATSTNANAPAAPSASSPPSVVVSQARVDAAATQLRRYYKELRDVKFAPQQMCAYMPNETPNRILERLRPAVITRGARLRQTFENCAMLKRMCPQDPRTIPGSPEQAAKLATAASSPVSAPLATPAPASASPPINALLPSPPAAAAAAQPISAGAASSGSPRKGSAAPLVPAPGPSSAPAAQRPASPQQTPQKTPAPPPVPPPAPTASARQQTVGRLWNVQAFWRCGYDLAVHYLQYGLVFDARVVLERLFIEYYNSSDDYVFVRSPAGTLERLGRVPNLFDAHGHASWTLGKTGYPRGLEAGAELLEGLLLVASAEMSCSLLLGDTVAAMTRYHAFMQVTCEKFEEWSVAEAKSGSRGGSGNGNSSNPSPTGALKPPTSQQFFLLQCYLSGVRMWWPTSGLCEPKRDLPPALVRATPPPPPTLAATAAASTAKTSADTRAEEGRSGSAHLDPTTPLPLAKLPSVHGCGGGAVYAFCPRRRLSDSEKSEAAERPDHEGDDTVAPHPGQPMTRHGSSIVTIATEADAVPDIAPVLSSDTDPLDPVPRQETELDNNNSGSSGVRYSITNPSFAFASVGPSGRSFRISSAIAPGSGSFSGHPYGDRSSARRATAPWGSSVHGGDAAPGEIDGAAAAAVAATPASAAQGEDDVADGAEGAGGEEELLYLLASSEDTAQAAVAYLVELATTTGLLAEHMGPAALHDAASGLHDAFEGCDARTARVLQHHRRRLHRSCTEAASLLEHARDALAAVAHDLGYANFGYPAFSSAAAAAAGESDANAGGTALTSTAAAAAFANVEELSTPDQALRLWRVLTAMAALALRIGEQRRREFHLYARLAVTFLADQPSMTASIVSERLLPYIKRQGWRRIELFVRRLYVEAREQLMRRAGLFASGTAAGSDPARRRLWLCVFRTGAAYVLYRECVLVLLSSSSSTDGGGSSDCIMGDEGAVGPSRGAEPRAAIVAAEAASCMAAEDLVGSLDSRLFSTRSRAAWWRELLRIDALVMGTIFHGEPPEYPLEHFTSPLTVKLEHRVTAAAERSCNDSAIIVNESSITVQPGVLQADVDDVVRFAFASVFTIDPLARPARSEGAAAGDAEAAGNGEGEGAPAVRFQLTLESRKDWGDEDEATHEVHISDADAVHFNAQTHQLHVSFTFPVCHAGLYRVRRLRLCNGNTWLAYYPQRSSGGGPGGVGGGAASVMSGGLYAAGWGSCQRGAGWHASTTLRSTRAELEPMYHPVGRAPVLRVPEPRSSVHLRLHLPQEAHCFADCVDYVTLEVELEDPLLLSSTTGAGNAAAAVTAGPGAGAGSGPAPLAPQQLLSCSADDAEDARAAHASAPATRAGAAAAAAAACTCSFEVSAGHLLLPLSVGAVHCSHPPQRSQPYVPLTGGGSSAHDARDGAAPLRRTSMSSAALNTLLPSMEEEDEQRGDAEEGVGVGGGDEGGKRAPRRPPFVAAVVLGTPATYRPKHHLASAAAGRTMSPGLSFPSLSAAMPGAAGFAGNANGASGVLGLSGSFGARPSQPADALAQSRHAVPPSMPTPPLLPTHVSAFASSLSSTDAPELAGSAVAASTAAAAGASTRAATPAQQRYKSIFKSLRIGPHAALEASPGASTMTASTSPALERSRATSPQLHESAHHRHHHAHRHSHLLPTPPERGLSDPRFASAAAADDAGNGMDERGSRHMAASLSGMLGPAVTPAAAPLREVSAGTYELVLVHADTATREDRSGTKADTASAAPSAPPSSGRTPAAAAVAATAAAAAAAAAGATTAARTVVPIHVRDFLQNLPAPEVQVRTPVKGPGGGSAGSLLRAESLTSADPLRETVIRLLPSGSSGAAAATTAGAAVTHMRLRLPLLPLLTTPITAAALSSKRPEVATSCKDAGDEDATPSAVVTANQARIAFTCVRGREPCTTTLNAVLPFQAAIEFAYVFKDFQGRVYCLVRMRNVLSSTSLWMRGAVLRVLDAEPSYEIVRVCEVYNRLLVTEWKPREELSILYELDLIASFHPAQPECTHRVQMEVFYSSWHRSFLTTPAEDRLVLRTMELPATEATAESVEVIHSDDRGLSDVTAVPGTATTASTGAPTSTLGTAPSLYQGPLVPGVEAARTTPLPRSASEASSQSLARATNTHRSGGSISSSSSSSNTAAMRNGEASNLSDAGDSSASARSPTEASGAVHFNVVTLRYLEETCNTIWGPIASFRSKHLCVFSIVMYAESPWTMRFGAATNYLAQPPSTPLSVTSTVNGGAPLPRTSMHPAGPSSSHLSAGSALSCSLHSGPSCQWGERGGGGGVCAQKQGRANASFFGNAMVDQPSDFVFVAGEPVRFCVRLQPQAQNWPEDAEMEETFFIRLKYNPAQWMVIGKQRDRRTLSLMEEVTVYFNAVPLLPLASAADTDTAPGEWGEEGRAPPPPDPRAKATGKVAERGSDDDSDAEEEDAAGSGAGARRSRTLAGHAVQDEGILQTPTVEMFWERKKPAPPPPHASKTPPAEGLGATKRMSASHRKEATAAGAQAAHADAVMGEAVLVDVVQFRTWVRVRKRGQ